MSDRLSESLMKNVFSAKRNITGTTTSDLFDGIDTITAAEIDANKIADSEGNFMALTSAIDKTNAVDVLKTIYQSA